MHEMKQNRSLREAFEVLPPRLIENGVERPAGPEDEVTLREECPMEGIFAFTRTWKNKANRERKIQTVFEIRTLYPVEHYVIPCVLYNGNPWGKGLEPKGLTHQGKPWVFSYDRESIPSCTLTENDEIYTALFASPADPISITSSCSLEKEDSGAMRQRIFHPVKEEPLTYCARDKYAPPSESYITLSPGESFTVTVYTAVGKPEWKNFGMAALLDQYSVLFPLTTKAVHPQEKIWEYGVGYAKRLITECKGVKSFIIGTLPGEDGLFHYRTDECFELGWCGQNALFARMLLEDYRRTGNRDSLSQGVEILDNWAERAPAASGLLCVQMRDTFRKGEASSDTCNMGWGAAELVRAYRLARSLGMEKPAWLQAARGLCDFFLSHFDERFGFGKEWKLTGECLDQGGTIGGFLLCAFVEMYKETKEEPYLRMAEKALRFYVERDLNGFFCTAGALDTTCIDKETSIPLILSSVELFGLTGKDIYLEYARKAAYYFTSWMYHYNVLYPAESDFERFGFTTMGGTAVSAQHHHIDAYGVMAVPALLRLADITGDSLWRQRAKALYDNTTQCISDGETPIRGKVRPFGSQNEGFHHCSWGMERGSLNDWLVAWPSSFRLYAISEADMGTLRLREKQPE